MHKTSPVPAGEVFYFCYTTNMIIIGHRGAKGLAPENTLKAIKAGIAAGADWIEIDVRATKDGQVVLMHNATTARVAEKKHTVAKTPYAKLTPVPTLHSVVEHVTQGVTLNIELKSAGCEQAAIAAAKHLGYDRVVVSSFSRAFLRRVHTLDPRIRLALLLTFNPFAFRRVSGLYAVGFYHLFAPRSAVALAKKLNLFTYAYTVDDPARAAALTARGIDAIVTNYPNKLKGLAAS